jgi:hypothetical protein
MTSWAILGSNKHTICSRHNINGEGWICKFDNLFLGVWCVIEFMHLSMHLHFFTNYGAWVTMSLDFCGPLSLTSLHNIYVLVMIEHFSKWLESVPLLD